MQKPIPNPCPEMEKMGYTYEYHKGLVDSTPYYTRVEEDSIIYTGSKYIIRFNLASKAIVFSLKENNEMFYGGHPTFFIDKKLLTAINKVITTLKWDE